MYKKVSIQERNMKKNKKNKIYPKNKMAANEKYKQSLKYLGGIIFHGLEY